MRLKRRQVLTLRLTRRREEMLFWHDLLAKRGAELNGSDFARASHFLSVSSGIYFETKRDLDEQMA